MIRCNANLFRIAALCQSDEATRYYLCGVYVEPHHTVGVTLTTTDGHRLLCIHDETGTADESAIIQLTADALKACKPKKGDLRTLMIDGPDAIVHAKPADVDSGGYTVGVSAHCRVEGAFPAYRNVVPQEKSDTVTDAFASEFLASFCTVATELAKHFHTDIGRKGYSSDRKDSMRLVTSEIGAPSFVLFEHTDKAFGLLMPTSKPNKSRGAPSWFRKPSVTDQLNRAA